MRGSKLGMLTLALILALAPGVAHAAGTGDDPREIKDRPSKETARVEKEYRRWLAAGSARPDGIQLAAIIGAPYQYFYTPTHPQERSYWCGPATAQTIDDYWGETVPQSSIAAMLGTTTAGTVFTRMDDVITALTGVPYVVSGACYSTGDVYSRVQYGLESRGHPLAADVRIVGSVWNNYVYNHDGHIIPIEAFDWRNMTVRVNDPYNEAASLSGGGQTLGHRTYPAHQVADGILRHFQKVLVY